MADDVVRFDLDKGDVATLAAALTCFMSLMTGQFFEAGQILQTYDVEGAIEATAIAAGNFVETAQIALSAPERM